MGLLSLARKKCVQQRSEWWASLVSPSLLLCLLRTLQGWRNVWIAPLHCRCNQEAEISFSSKWSHKYRYEINFQETFRFHKNVPITVWNKHIPAYQHMNLFFFFHHYKITTSVSCFNIYRILHSRIGIQFWVCVWTRCSAIATFTSDFDFEFNCSSLLLNWVVKPFLWWVQWLGFITKLSWAELKTVETLHVL